MNGVVAIVAANVRRRLNDRSNLFFMVALPLLLVFALGAAFGGSAADIRVGVVDPRPSEASTAVRDSLADRGGVEVRSVSSAAALKDQVARKIIDVGWVARTDADSTVTLDWVEGADGEAQMVRQDVEMAARGSDVDAKARQIVAADTGASGAELERAVTSGESAASVQVTRSRAGGQTDSDANRTVVAGGELTLFIFLTSLFGATALLLSRQLGVTRRSQVAPVTARQVIGGEAASAYLLALIQAVIIIGGSTLLFGITWRSPVAMFVLSAAMALVGCGVAMILGTVARSEQQVAAVSLLAGLVLAALGGSMLPLEFFPSTMRTIALSITPHAWMNDAIWKLQAEGKGFVDILPNLGVLVTAGLVLLLFASRLLARSIR